MAGTDTLVWLAGRVHSAGNALISAIDHGVLVGDGVFETCKVVGGVPFALSRHLRRLQRSADLLGLACPTPGKVRDAATELLDAAGPMELGKLRITITAGPGPLGSDRGIGQPSLILAVSPAQPWPDRIAVITVPWPRNERSAVSGAKTTSYAENVVALRAAHERGAHEALFTNTRQFVCEGTGSNVVIERDGVLVTPPLAAGCLAGITRELLLEWAAEECLPLVENDVTPQQLAQTPELLLTSSTRDVQQVSALDGRAIQGSALGLAAVEIFRRRAALDVDP